MRLSTLLDEFSIVKSYEVFNEQEFDTLALVRSNIPLDYCTFLDDEKYATNIPSHAKMMLTTKSIAEKLKDNHLGICIVDNPRIVYFKLHNCLENSTMYIRDKTDTTIGNNCNISKLTSIANKNVIIGNNVIIEEFVTIRENTIIGDNCIIRSGVKLGSVDFEFKYDGNHIFGVNHYGGIVIEDNVEIQCNSVVNRGLYPWDDTVIGDFTKIDAGVIISHGVKIGKRNMITGQSVVGGRTIIGDDCWIGLNSTIKNGLTIGNQARINMGAVVSLDVAEHEAVTGNFAIEHRKFIENMKKSIT